MLGKVLRDMMYFEVFADHSPDDPMDIALREGDIVEVLNDYGDVLIEEKDGLSYGTIPLDDIELLPEEE